MAVDPSGKPASSLEVKRAIRSQYRAALDMLREAVVRCPEALWDAPEDQNRFWHVAYHVLFFTHLYLQRSQAEFRPWARHRERYHLLGTAVGEPYGKEDVLAYLEVCRGQVDERVADLDLAAQSGFRWLPFGKLELQLYNVRHVQQHTGELMERLGARAGVEVGWVAAGPE